MERTIDFVRSTGQRKLLETRTFPTFKCKNHLDESLNYRKFNGGELMQQFLSLALV